MSDVPLLELFTRLREAGLPLGLGEYQLALKAIQSGFGIRDRASLARVCRTLWVKSPDEQVLFNYHFDKVMAEDAATLPVIPSEDLTTGPPVAPPEETALLRWRRRAARYRYWLVTGGCVVAAIAALPAFFDPLPKNCPRFVRETPSPAISKESYAYSIRVETCPGDDASDLTWNVIQKPEWLTFTPGSNGTAAFGGTPPLVKDGTVEVRSLPDGEVTPLQAQHLRKPVSLSEDGAYIGTISSEGTVRIWDPQGTVITKVEVGEDVQAIKFSPDGSHFLTLSTVETGSDRTDNTTSKVDLWQNNSAQDQPPLLTQTYDVPVTRLTFSPGGQTFAVTKADYSVSVLDLAGKVQMARPHTNPPYVVSFSQDGQRLATAVSESSLQLSDRNGKSIAQVRHLPENGEVDVSPSGKHFSTYTYSSRPVSVSRDGEYWTDFRPLLWYFNQRSLVEIPLPPDVSGQLRFSPSGEYFLTEGREASQLWRLQADQLTEITLPASFDYAGFSPSGQYLASFAGSPAQLWQLQGNQLIEIPLPPATERVDFRAGDQGLVTRSNDGKNQLWRLTGQTLAPINLPKDLSSQNLDWTIEISSTATYLLGTSSAERPRLLASSQAQAEAIDLPAATQDARLLASGKYLLTRDEGDSVDVFRLEGRALKKLGNIGKIDSLGDIRVGSTGKYLIAPQADVSGSRVFSLGDTQLSNILSVEGSTSLWLSPQDTYLSTYSPLEYWRGAYESWRDDYGNAYSQRLWYLENKTATEITLPEKVSAIKFSADDQRLMSGEIDKTLVRNDSNAPSAGWARVLDSSAASMRLWQLEQARLTELQTWPEISDIINFSADNSYMVSTVRDDKIYLSALDTAAPKQNKPIPIELDAPVLDVFFDAERSLAAIAQDGHFKQWDFAGNLTQDVPLPPAAGERYLSDTLEEALIAEVTDQKNVSILNTKGQPLATLEHDAAVKLIDSSSDGQDILTSTQETIAHFWNLPTSELKQLSLKDNVSKIALSPNGEVVAAIVDGNLLRFMDLDGNVISEIAKHDQEIEQLKFHPNGDRLITATSDTLYCWRWDQQEVLWSHPLNGAPTEVFIHPDGQLLVTATKNDFTLLDFEGNQLGFQNLKDEPSLYMSPRGGFVKTDDYWQDQKVWKISDQQIQPIELEEGSQKITFGSNSDYFLSQQRFRSTSKTADGSAVLYNPEGQKVAEIAPSYADDGPVHFTADGNHLITPEQKYSLNVEDISSGEMLSLPHDDEIQQVRLSPDDHYIATLSGDRGALKVWDLSGKVIANFNNDEGFHNFEFTGDGQHIVALAGSQGYIFNFQEETADVNFQHNINIDTLKLSDDRQYFVTASGWDGTARLWDAQGQLIEELVHKAGVLGAQFVAETESLITVSGDGLVNVWDLRGQIIKTIPLSQEMENPKISANGQYLLPKDDFYPTEGESLYLWNLSGSEPSRYALSLESLGEQGNVGFINLTFSPDGNYLFLETGYGQTIIWRLDRQSPKQLKTFDEAKSFDWSPTGKAFLVIEADDPSIVHIWEPTSASINERTLKSDQEIDSATFSEDGQALVLHLADGKISLLDLQGQPIAEAKTVRGKAEMLVSQKLLFTRGIHAVNVWSLDGKLVNEFDSTEQISDFSSSQENPYLAIAREDGTALFWDFMTDRQIPFRDSHNGRINRIRFSHDGRRLITASSDQSAKLWNRKGKRLTTFWPTGDVSNAFFSADDQSITTASGIDRFLDKYERYGHLYNSDDYYFGSASDYKDAQNNISPYEKYSNGSYGSHIIYQTSIAGATTQKIGARTGSLSPYHGYWQHWQYWQQRDTFPEAVLENKETIHLWSRQGEKIGSLPLQDTYESMLSTSPDGEYVATLSGGAVPQVHIRQIRNQQNIANLPLNAIFNTLEFSPDSEYFLTVSDSSLETVSLEITDGTGKTIPETFDITTHLAEPTATAEPKQVNWLPLIGGGGLAIAGLLGGYFLTRRWLANRNDEEPAQNDPASAATPTSDGATSFAQVMPEIEDELQVAQAVQPSARKRLQMYSSSDTQDYTPVTHRQMKQSWRYLRKFVREGPPIEFDVDATVRQIGRDGLLLRPVFVPRRVNRTELLLLIDRDGSMVPFHSLAERLIETAAQGGRLGQTTTYYFHNCPDDYLYPQPDYQTANLLKTVLSRLHTDYGGVLIFSDAGAARGVINPARLALTRTFVQQLKQEVKYMAWVNPVPRERWPGTTAQEIAKLIPMFEFNRQGLHQAIGVLQGKSLHIV